MTALVIPLVCCCFSGSYPKESAGQWFQDEVLCESITSNQQLSVTSRKYRILAALITIISKLLQDVKMKHFPFNTCNNMCCASVQFLPYSAALTQQNLQATSTRALSSKRALGLAQGVWNGFANPGRHVQPLGISPSFGPAALHKLHDALEWQIQRWSIWLK